MMKQLYKYLGQQNQNNKIQIKSLHLILTFIIHNRPMICIFAVY